MKNFSFICIIRGKNTIYYKRVLNIKFKLILLSRRNK